MKQILSLTGLVSLFVLAGCGASDVGEQSDAAPIAVATALGVGAPNANKVFSVRATSDIVLSAKESSGVDEPLLGFDWQQIDSTGIAVTLFERSTNSRAFTAPDVDAVTELMFQLTVTDAVGVSASDTVSISVVPVIDANKFLLNPAIDESLYLFVSPPPNTVLAADAPFSVTVTPIVYWTDRRGTDRIQALSPETFSSFVPAGFVGPVSVVDPGNKFFRFQLPLLDIDEVNRFYQGANRSGRLELELVSGARTEFRIELMPGSGADLNVYLANSDDAFELIMGPQVLGALEDPALFPQDGAIASALNGPLIAQISGELVRQNLDLESDLSAGNYYACIDPDQQTLTLSGWLAQAGFGGASDVARARYTNNFDLGFGRDMFLRKDDNGNVYSYVVNYPSLESTVQGRGEFATVAMEYSAAPTGQCGDGTFSDVEKIVKFYSFVPDISSGEMVRANSMNFDGRGERYAPGVCIACHGGSVDAQQLNVALTDVPASAVDVDASFMPWDLDSFLFSQASDSNLVDPDYSTIGFTSQQIDSTSRENQEAQFRALNEGALATYVDDLKRYEEPIRLIHGWYGNSAALPEPLNDADARDDPDVPSPLVGVAAEVLLTLPANNFDGSYIQPEWQAQTDLYHNVFARHCRLCHVQQSKLGINFDSYAEFIENETLTARVFQQGSMPLARLTMDRMWVPFPNASTAPAELLRQHLVSAGAQISGSPGDPVPNIGLSGQLFNSLGETVTMDGTDSLFADSYQWSVDSNCGSVPPIQGAAGPVATFVADASPCEYSVTLSVANSRGTVDAVADPVSVDRIPAAVNFDASLAGYTPGDGSLLISILERITNPGDGSLTVIVNNAADPYNLAINPNVTNNNDGTVTMAFPALAGTADNFEYQIADVNGTLAPVIGSVTLSVPAIVPMLASPMNVTASSVELAWSVPAGFMADSYIVYRDDVEVSTVSGDTLAFTNDMLPPGATLTYEVSARLGSEESARSNQIGVSLASGVPGGLSLIGRTTTSAVINWSQGPGGTPDSYNVYRDNNLVATVPSPPYNEGSLTPNQNYQYRVSANFGASETAQSMPFDTATLTAAPTSLSVSVRNTNSISLDWVDNNNANSPSYQVFNFGMPVGSPTTSSATTVSGLISNFGYAFTVRATGIAGSSGDSNSVTTSTLVSYSTDVFPLINAKRGGAAGSCSGCHAPPGNGGFAVAGTAAMLYGELTEDIGDASGQRINLASPASSRILVCVNSGCGTMLSSDIPAWSASETTTIRTWIEENAAQN